MLGDSKKLTILSGLSHLSLIHGWPIALGKSARPTKPASSSTVAGGRGTVVEPLFCNRAARVKDFKLELAPRMVVRQGSLFCPRSAQAAAASWSQARARRINLRGCVVANRARSFGHHGGGRALESCGLVNHGLERERRHSANAGHRHQAAAHLVVPGHRQHGPLQ
jgi:hypothetical protein